MLLTPALNVPIPVPLRSVDIYISIFFILYLLSTGVTNSLVTIGKAPILALFALTILMLGIELVYGLGDSTGISLSIRSIATILAALGFSKLLWKTRGEESLEIFFKVTITCAIAQGIVLWLSFFSTDFRYLMSLIFHRDELVGGDHLTLLRVPGFVGSGGDGLSLNHGLLCTVAALGVFSLYPKSLKRTLLLGLIIVANTGSAFTGRSGFYLASVLIAIIILTYKNGKLRALRFFYFILFAVFVLLILSTFSSQIGTYGLALRDEYGYEYPIVRLLDGFINMNSDGVYEDRTISRLLHGMIFFPPDPLRLLIGNNDFGQMPVNYIESDIGYIRMIHGFGLIGILFFLIGVFVIPVLVIYRLKILFEHNFARRSPEIVSIRFLAQVMILILLYGLISHWKIFYLSTRMFLYVFFLLLSLTFLKMISVQKRLQAQVI